MKEDNEEKLKYIYFEIFDKKEEDIKIIKTSLKKLTFEQIEKFDKTFNNLESEGR